MPSLISNQDDLSSLSGTWTDESWVVACLCAEWCDVCKQYRENFEQLATRHPDKQFVWIDVEDQAELVGDFEVENFPTLLVQRGNTVAFFGTVLPDTGQANRLIQSLATRSHSDLQTESMSTPERRRWQENENLLARLQAARD